MADARTIQALAKRRGITRVCHFTPSRNLAHIALDPRGVLASAHLQDDERSVFNPTDHKRFDGHTEYVCCSIQYPNAWFFRTARANECMFLDWVVLLVHARCLWKPGTKFCPRNAAAEHGALVREGLAAFDSLFEQTVEGRQTYTRTPRQPNFLPTDQQAEVLVPDRIERNEVLGIAVRSEAQARRELSRLGILEGKPPPLVIAPAFYEPARLSSLLHAGTIPEERAFHEGSDHVR